MRILMLGNSYIFTNDPPSILAEITGAEVVQNTRGGARLREQLNPETRLGAKALELLQNENGITSFAGDEQRPYHSKGKLYAERERFVR